MSNIREILFAFLDYPLTYIIEILIVAYAHTAYHLVRLTTASTVLNISWIVTLWSTLCVFLLFSNYRVMTNKYDLKFLHICLLLSPLPPLLLAFLIYKWGKHQQAVKNDLFIYVGAYTLTAVLLLVTMSLTVLYGVLLIFRPTTAGSGMLYLLSILPIIFPGLYLAQLIKPTTLPLTQNRTIRGIVGILLPMISLLILR